MKNSFIKYIPIKTFITFFLISLIFVFYPQIDLIVSNIFYKKNEGFYLNGSMFEGFFYDAVPVVIISSFSLVFILYFINKKLNKSILKISGRKTLFLLLTGVIGSGLICETIMKETFRRERPRYISEFGNNYKFTPAFTIAKKENNSPSFPSGHAAGAFLMMAFAMIFYKYKILAMTLAVIYGILVSFARIIAGGHFLSDTVTSFFVMLIVAKIFYSLIVKKDNKEGFNT